MMKASFDESVKRLNEIIALLQDPEVKLEESIELYSEGVTLLADCGEMLREAELKITKKEA